MVMLFVSITEGYASAEYKSSVQITTGQAEEDVRALPTALDIDVIEKQDEAELPGNGGGADDSRVR